MEVKFGISAICKCRNRVAETLLQKGACEKVEVVERDRSCRKIDLQKFVLWKELSYGKTIAEKKACGNLSCRIEPAEAEVRNRVAGEEIFGQEPKFRVF